MVEYLKVTMPKGDERYMVVISEAAYNAMPHNDDYEVVSGWNDQNKIRRQIALLRRMPSGRTYMGRAIPIISDTNDFFVVRYQDGRRTYLKLMVRGYGGASGMRSGYLSGIIHAASMLKKGRRKKRKLHSS